MASGAVVACYEKGCCLQRASSRQAAPDKPLPVACVRLASVRTAARAARAACRAVLAQCVGGTGGWHAVRHCAMATACKHVSILRWRVQSGSHIILSFLLASWYAWCRRFSTAGQTLRHYWRACVCSLLSYPEVPSDSPDCRHHAFTCLAECNGGCWGGWVGAWVEAPIMPRRAHRPTLRSGPRARRKPRPFLHWMT